MSSDVSSREPAVVLRWRAQGTLSMPGRQGWAVPPPDLPADLLVLLNHPGPLLDAVAALRPGSWPVAEMLDHRQVRALADMPIWLNVDVLTPIMRHRELILTGEGGGAAGYSEVRWVTGRVDAGFGERMRDAGLEAAVKSYIDGGTVELLFAGGWSPVTEHPMLGRVWRLVGDDGPVVVVTDAVAPLDLAEPQRGQSRPSEGYVNVRCRECGNYFGVLAHHLVSRHGLTTASYQTRHGVGIEATWSAATRHLRAAGTAARNGAGPLWNPDTIRRLRISLGESQGRFGARLGVSGSVVSSWEHGRRRPHPRYHEVLTAVYDGLDRDARARLVEAASGVAVIVPVTRLRPLAEDGRPVWLRIADRLRDAIREGVYPAGSPLPTGTQISRHYHVSLKVVYRATTVLTAEGLIHLRPHFGTFPRLFVRDVLPTAIHGVDGPLGLFILRRPAA